MNLLKAVVVLAGARDQYQVPLALAEAGLLQTLVTDSYWPADRKWFSRSAGKLLPPRLVAARYCAGLDSRRVRLSVKALGSVALMKALRTARLNRYKDAALSRKALRLAIKEGAALFAYSYYASEAFKATDGRLPHRFLFQLHPHPEAVRAILREEAERVPQAHASLMAEHEVALPDDAFAEMAREPHLANGWVVASRFTASTLVERGIPGDQIHVVPYGVDHHIFTARSAAPRADQPLTVLYIGSLSQRKGLSYLLDAVRSLNTRAVRLVLCGRGIVDEGLLAAYSGVGAEVHIGLSRAELIRQMHRADLFVLPSLAEGFGHVILEAMSCGLPVVATPHTCAPDVIEPGTHGFVVPLRDADAIAGRITWAVDHRSELAAMGEAAAARARAFSWERFRAGVREAYQKMIAAQASGATASPTRAAALRV
jgi:glycosyltransferase involved in cell wall biosynthesis